MYGTVLKGKMLQVAESFFVPIFAASLAKENFQIPRGALSQHAMLGEAEMIPVEPDQGNACAGKVEFLFPTLRFRSISLKSFF